MSSLCEDMKTVSLQNSWKEEESFQIQHIEGCVSVS